MANSVSLSELHGVVKCDEGGDQGFDEIPHHSDEPDDVFVDDDQLNRDDIEECSTIGGLQEFSRVRKRTSKSSGYGSENPVSESGEKKFFEKNSEASSTLKQEKEKRSVFSQTDFSDEEAIDKNLPLELFSPKIIRDSLPEHLGHFCWRHDSVYDKMIVPPARPSSVSSDGKNLEKMQLSYRAGLLHPKKVNLSNKACEKCKYDEYKKIDLYSRKELNNLKKETLHPTVAEIKNCAANLLADEIDHCSNLWTENRTFYLGTPRRKSCQSARRKRALSFPTTQDQNLSARQWRCFHCNNASNTICDAETHRSCSRHLFWIQRASISAENKLLSNKETPKRNKRDWILVQCVTKFVLSKKSSSNDEIKFSYREHGVQEMILCPHDLRSIEYIEDICCQHFIKMTRKDALEDHRVLELLYSPKGPMLREEKHLEGKSIFYFCCDFSVKTNRRKYASFSYPFPSKDEDGCGKSMNILSNCAKTSALSAKRLATDVYQQRHPSAGHQADKVTKFLRNRRHRVTLHAKHSHQGNFSTNSTDKKEESGRKQDTQQLTANKSGEKESKRIEEKLDDKHNDKMKKNVSFAENLKTCATAETDKKSAQDEEVDGKLNFSRRHSMPPPPPKYLGEEENDIIYRRRKRKESVAISFDGKASLKKDQSLPPGNKQSQVRSYGKPTWVGVKIRVGFKEKIFTGDFMEYHTLEDLYSWVKTQLLNHNLFTPGTDLLLSSENIKFPLKANTANNTMSSLQFTEFVCTEIQQPRRSSGFGDTESRYDTRFSLPVDLRKLESLTPTQYLSKYCHISETWKIFYRSIFTQYDHDRDGCICYKQLQKAMEKLFVELAHPLLKRVLFLLGFDPSSQKAPVSVNHSAFDDAIKYETENWKDNLTIDKETFIFVCALSNRIICRENKIDGFSVATVKQSHTELEDADFYNIEGKLRECTLNPLTKSLLLYIKK